VNATQVNGHSWHACTVKTGIQTGVPPYEC